MNKPLVPRFVLLGHRTFFVVSLVQDGDSPSEEISLEKNDQQHPLHDITAVTESRSETYSPDANDQPPSLAGYNKATAAVLDEEQTGCSSDVTVAVSGEEEWPQCYSSPAADPSEGVWRKCARGVQDSPAYSGGFHPTWWPSARLHYLQR